MARTGRPFVDWSGKRVGSVTMIERQNGLWRANCDCGQEVELNSAQIQYRLKLPAQCRCAASLPDMIKGIRSGKLTCSGVSKRHPTNSGYETRWRCKCDCGGSRWLKASEFTRRQSCGCAQSEHLKEKIPAWYFIKLRAGVGANAKGPKRKTYAFTVTREWLRTLLNKQGERCVYTGVPIGFTTSKHWGATASLDRIDSEGGYTENNVQWVHKTVNMMKQQLGNAEFIDWCRLVAAHSDAAKTTVREAA